MALESGDDTDSAMDTLYSAWVLYGRRRWLAARQRKYKRVVWWEVLADLVAHGWDEDGLETVAGLILDVQNRRLSRQLLLKGPAQGEDVLQVQRLLGLLEQLFFLLDVHGYGTVGFDGMQAVVGR